MQRKELTTEVIPTILHQLVTDKLTKYGKNKGSNYTPPKKKRKK